MSHKGNKDTEPQHGEKDFQLGLQEASLERSQRRCIELIGM